MAGPNIENDADLKGLGKIFNSRTISGRANVSVCVRVRVLAY